MILIKQILQLMLVSLCSLATASEPVIQSYGTIYTDDTGDAEIGKPQDECFDLVRLHIENISTHTLRYSVETAAAIPERPEKGRTWIGLYIDLDKNNETGLVTGSQGADLVVTMNSVSDGQGAHKWVADIATPSPIGRQFEFETKLVHKEANRFTIEVNSPNAFRAYPQFYLQFYSQKDGIWIDHFDSMRALSPVTLFPVSDAAINYTDSATIKRKLVAPAAHIERVTLPASNRTREIIAKIDFHYAHKKGNYTSYVRINLKNEAEKDIVKFRLALSKERKGKAVARIYVNGDSEEPHYMGYSDNPRFLGKHEMILRIDEKQIAEFEVDGRVLERRKLDFTIHSAEIRAGSCTATVEASVQ